MTHTNSFCRFILIFAFVFTLSSVPAIAQDKWTSARSKNFHLIGNAREADIRRVATKLEQFREVFVRLFPTLVYESSVPTTVIVFRNEKSFKPYKPLTAEGKPSEWIAGYFTAREDANYIVLSTEKESKQTYQTIYHEFVHYLVDNSLGRTKVPPWFNEGLAEYYDQFELVDESRVRLGVINDNHLISLQRSRMLPLEELVKVDYFTLHQQGKHSANIFYAQSWALMHYLIHGNEGKRAEQISQYLAGIRKGQESEDAFRAAFKMEFAEMDKELRSYVAQNTFKALSVTFKEKLPSAEDIALSPMTLASANAYLGDLLLGSGRVDEATALLTEALAAEPDNVFANSSMGMAKMRKRQFTEAKVYLEKARMSGDPGHLVHYRYAYLLSREEMNASGWVSSYSAEKAAQIRDSLKKAIAARPTFAESYSLLAFVALVRNDEIDDAIGNIRVALGLSPGNENYLLDLAGLYARKHEFDQAKKIAEDVYSSAKDAETRDRASAVLRNNETLRRAMEASRTGNRPPNITGTDDTTVFVIGDRPLNDAEMQERLEDAQMKAIAAALRKPSPNETRVLGHLTAITCSNGTITFKVRADGKTIDLTSKDFQNIEMMAYAEVPDMMVGCDSIKKELFAVVTYVAGESLLAKSDGQIVAIEVVPERFKLQ